MFNRYWNSFFVVLLSGCLLALALPVMGQNDTVKLRVIITDAYSKTGVQGANVVNRTTGAIAVTDINGYVETTAGRNDKLYIFSTGYHSIPVSLADSVVKSSYFLRLVIEPFSAGLDKSVIILGNKTLENIGTDKQHLGQTPADLKKPKMGVFDVMAQLYDKVNARGKEREKLKKEIVSDDRWKVMSEYLNYCNERKLISLPEEEYGDFIDYCGMSVTWLKSHSDYEIISAITGKFETYNKQKSEKK